jgi:hypothetical protein
MNRLLLNIGLNINGVEALTPDQILNTVTNALSVRPEAFYIRTATSGERTACISCRTLMVEDQLVGVIMHLCNKLQQEAIAGRFYVPFGALRNFLIGPKAEAWGGEFNPEFWLAVVPDNAPIPANEALAKLLHASWESDAAGYAISALWHVGTKNGGMAGWFENQRNGNGGELIYSLENPDTGETDGYLHLCDYDGVAVLPLPVIRTLREMGVSVGNDYE